LIRPTISSPSAMFSAVAVPASIVFALPVIRPTRHGLHRSGNNFVPQIEKLINSFGTKIAIRWIGPQWVPDSNELPDNNGLDTDARRVISHPAGT
jgi:hypothetical protein